MKFDKIANTVLLIHIACLAAGGLLGALLGAPYHVMLGISLGSLLASLIPGIGASMALRRSHHPNSATHICAAVFSNDWITADVNRSAVEELRGYVYITWMGITIGALVAGFALNALLGGCLLASAIGGLLAWFINRVFTL